LSVRDNLRSVSLFGSCVSVYKKSARIDLDLADFSRLRFQFENANQFMLLEIRCAMEKIKAIFPLTKCFCSLSQNVYMHVKYTAVFFKVGKNLIRQTQKVIAKR